MPRALAPIPLGTPITDRDGTITPFFRLRMEAISEGWSQTASASRVSLGAQTAAVASRSVLTVVIAGVYRVSWYLRKTRADGASSSVAVTLGFVDVDGTALTITGGALTLDSVAAWQGVTIPIRCGAPTDITVAVAYASGTPGQMRYDLEIAVEFLPS
jgi:hypothetical protein